MTISSGDDGRTSLGRTMVRSRILVVSFPLLLLAGGGPATGPTAAVENDEEVCRDTTPPLLSLYLPIPLGVPRVEAQSTGVFIPANYRVGKTIDLFVFLRGYDIKRPQTATSVEEYWNSPRHPVLKSFMLREEINRSG